MPAVEGLVGHALFDLGAFEELVQHIPVGHEEILVEFREDRDLFESAHEITQGVHRHGEEIETISLNKGFESLRVFQKSLAVFG